MNLLRRELKSNPVYNCSPAPNNPARDRLEFRTVLNTDEAEGHMKVIRIPLKVAASAVLVITAASPCWSAGSSSTANSTTASTSATISKMEVRLLDHDYKTDTEDERLSRLEKFVFGGPESGTDKERVDRLTAAIVPTAPTAADAAAADASKTTTKTTTKTAVKGVDKAAGKGSAKDTPVASATAPATKYDPSDFGSYPRVAQLEQQFFNKTFTSDPLPVRVSRLETKEFGKPEPNEDLCDRMDRLDRIALKPTPGASEGSAAGAGFSGPPLKGGTPIAYGPDGKPAPAGQHWVQYGDVPVNSPFSSFNSNNGPSDPDAPAKPVIENPFLPGSPNVNGVEQRTSTLEKFVFGHEHVGKPIAERVEKLEKKLVPYEHNNDKDIATRVDHLWTMLNAANTNNTSPTSTD
jgi:hypothetical protein